MRNDFDAEDVAPPPLLSAFESVCWNGLGILRHGDLVLGESLVRIPEPPA